jgi:hypothetical protein
MLMPGIVSIPLMNWFDRAEGLHGAIQNSPKFLVRHRGTIKVVLIKPGRIWGKEMMY